MATFTVIETGVVDRDLAPTITVVAVGTLVGVMSRRRMVQVTGGAGIEVGVIKGNQLPIFGRVAG